LLPTTFAGIVLFLVFLLPGFTFTLSRERHRPVRRLSAFRETAWTVLVSSVTVLTAGTLSLLVSIFNLDIRAIGRQVVSDPAAYVRAHPLLSAGAVIAYVSIAGVLSWVAGSSVPRAAWRHISRRSPVDPAASSWWVLFDEHPDLEKLVGIALNDGTWIGGTLRSWSRDADESADRDLTIQAPIYIRNSNSNKIQLIEEAGALAISARSILYLTVEYPSDK
jgi:hypothetical protein